MQVAMTELLAAMKNHEDAISIKAKTERCEQINDAIKTAKEKNGKV
jgi:hypothetical protein